MKNQKSIVFIGLGLLVVLIIYLIVRLFPTEDSEYSRQLQERQAALSRLKTNVDSSVQRNPDINVADDIGISQEVSQMPEFSLALAEADWFNTERMQAVGVELGFNDQASVSQLGSQLVWTQGVRTVSIDSQLGLINFTTAFNLGGEELPNQVPTEDVARQALTGFLDKTQLPSYYLDLENLSFEYMELDPTGVIAPSITGQGLPSEASAKEGLLIKVSIPYAVSGVQIILPIENYAIVDSEGVIRSLSLLLLNLKQEDQVLRVVSWEKARQQLEDGIGVVIDVEDQIEDQLRVDSLSVAYYLNTSTFYGVEKKRVLVPVYVFSGEDGKVAVLATQE